MCVCFYLLFPDFSCSAMVREQNQGLALELGGHEFKPRMNGKSLELASTMKALSVRMPEMAERKQQSLLRSQKEEEDVSLE